MFVNGVRACAMLVLGFAWVEPSLRCVLVAPAQGEAQPASRPAVAPANKGAPAFAGLDFDETRSLVVRYRETDHWALKAILLLSLGRQWHPVASPTLKDAIAYRDDRVRAFAVEALLATDEECLQWSVDAELLQSILGQARTAKNSFYKTRLVECLRRVVPKVDGESTNSYGIDAFSRWFEKTKQTFTPAPYRGIPTKPRGPARQSVTAVDRFLTRAVDLNLSGLDVCICIDSTGSMQPVIQAARAGLGDMVAMLRGLAPKFRLGLVHYKDRGELQNGARVLSALTPDASMVERLLSKLQASGGGDFPEAVDGGLDAALHAQTMGWTPQANKLIVLIGDAPPHAENIEKAVSLAREAYERPFQKSRSIPTDGVVDRNANRPFITSAIAVNPHADTTAAFRRISDAGGGMTAILPIGGGAPTEATAQIVQQILALTFGREFTEEAEIFVKVYLEYRANLYIK